MCIIPLVPKNADVAHLVERHLAKVEVAGSSPVIRSIKSHLCLLTKVTLLLVRCELSQTNSIKKGCFA